MDSDLLPQAVIFDLDGTLVDTLHDLAAALNRTLAELNLPPHAPDAVRGMVGGGLGKLFDRGLAAHGATLDDAGRQRAEARLVALYAAEPAARSRLYPGAAHALAGLSQAGVPLGLCTNKPEPIARDLLQVLGVADAFGCIQGSDAGLPRKPDPAGATHIMARLGVDPAKTIMVGDSLTDVKTARAAGLGGVVLVSYGYSATPAQTLGADAVIDHLDELPQALALLASPQKREA
jgi:phosphoglycolate phosphatase